MKLLFKIPSLFFIILTLLLACNSEEVIEPSKFTLDKNSEDFGMVVIGKKLNKEFRITNEGGMDLELKSFIISGNSNEFLVNAEVSVLSPGNVYVFSIDFVPSSEGEKLTELTITSNLGSHNLDISGQGTFKPGDFFSLSDVSKDFENVYLGKTVEQEFSITNNQDEILTITGISLEGVNKTEFTLNSDITTLDSGASAMFTVTFKANSLGQKIANVTIASGLGNQNIGLEAVVLDIDVDNIVNIPDVNFKAALLSDKTINFNEDNEIQVNEASDFNGSIKVNEKLISDLTGIEAFINTTELLCYDNFLTTLNIESNVALESLICSGNQLTVLNTSTNANLRSLNCNNNKLEVLDLSNNLKLSFLGCGYNLISSIDVSNNTDLKSLDCENNQLTNLLLNSSLRSLDCNNNSLHELDVTANSGLTYFYCGSNQLKTVDVSKNTELNQFWCDNNEIETLNLENNKTLGQLVCHGNKLKELDVQLNTNLFHLDCSSNELTILKLSHNIFLNTLSCHFNKLTELNISIFPGLKRLHCKNNLLTSLNVANGINAEFTDFWAENNPSLICIKVDEGFTPPNKWLKDTSANYNTDCQ